MIPLHYLGTSCYPAGGIKILKFPIFILKFLKGAVRRVLSFAVS
jgi:hypothetical protein